MGCYGSWVRGRSGGSCRASILPYQTCHRRFQQWVRSGALEKVLRKLAKRLQAEGRLNLEEAFIDATLCGGKKRGLGVGPTKRGKGTKITAIATGHSLPLAVSVQAASPHESQLVEEALGNSFLNELPAKLIGDKAYDSDPLDRVLWNTGGVHTVELYARVRRAVQAEGRSERAGGAAVRAGPRDGPQDAVVLDPSGLSAAAAGAAAEAGCLGGDHRPDPGARSGPEQEATPHDLVAWIIPKNVLSLVFSTLGVV